MRLELSRMSGFSFRRQVTDLEPQKKVQLEVQQIPSIKMQKNESHGKAERKVLEKNLWNL